MGKLSEPPDAGEIDRRNSDSSDFEETYIKKKGKKKEKKAGPAERTRQQEQPANHCKFCQLISGCISSHLPKCCFLVFAIYLT